MHLFAKEYLEVKNRTILEKDIDFKYGDEK